METVKKKEPEHVPLGGSSAERWSMCLGSTSFIEESGIVFSGNQYTAEGSVAHKVAEHKLKVAKGLASMDDAVLGSKYKQDGFTITVSENMLKAVDIYLAWVAEVEKRYDIKPEDSWIEKSVTINHPTITMRGKADYMAHVPYSTLVVADYKHGENQPVSVENNFQALYYAAGGLEALSEEDRDEVRQVLLAIIQPRTFATNKVQEMLIPKEEVLRFRDWLISRAEMVKPGAPLTAGKWCLWCPVKDICPERGKQALMPAKDAGADFETVEIKDHTKLKKLYATLPDEKVFELYSKLHLMTDFVVSIQKRAIEIVEKKGSSTGYEVTFGIGNSAWKESVERGDVPEAFRDYVSDIFGEAPLCSPTHVKEELEKLEPGELKDSLLKTLAAMTHRPPTKTKKIVPITEDITDGI